MVWNISKVTSSCTLFEWIFRRYYFHPDTNNVIIIRLVTFFISVQKIRSFLSTVCIWSVEKTARPSPYLDVQPRNPLYILKGNVWALLRILLSPELVFSPPALTICSTGESLPKPFTPLDVSPYSLFHDSLSIPRRYVRMFIFYIVFFEGNATRTRCQLFFPGEYFQTSQVLEHIHVLPDVRPLSGTRCISFV